MSWRTWLSQGFDLYRQAPLISSVWLLMVTVPVVLMARWSFPLGWMIAMVVYPVFVGGIYHGANFIHQTDETRPRKQASVGLAFHLWYVPALRARLLTLGGIFAIFGVVIFGIQLSAIGAASLLLEQGYAGVAVAANVFLAILTAAGALSAVVGFSFAIPLVTLHDLDAFTAVRESVTLWRTATRSVATLHLVGGVILLAAVPTLGLAALIGGPIFLYAVYFAVAALRPDPV